MNASTSKSPVGACAAAGPKSSSDQVGSSAQPATCSSGFMKPPIGGFRGAWGSQECVNGGVDGQGSNRPSSSSFRTTCICAQDCKQLDQYLHRRARNGRQF